MTVNPEVMKLRVGGRGQGLYHHSTIHAKCPGRNSNQWFQHADGPRTGYHCAKM